MAAREREGRDYNRRARNANPGIDVSQLPYLRGDVRRDFDAWSASAYARYVPPLTFTELRRGVQAVSRLAEGEALRATEGVGKRGALATYFAQVAFLVAYHAAEMLDLAEGEPITRIVDLGCGTGGAGAALSRALGGKPVVGVDRSGWALDEARLTWEALGVPGRAQREEPLHVLRAVSVRDLVLLSEPERSVLPEEAGPLGARLAMLARRGTRVLVLGPLASPPGYWPLWSEALSASGGREEFVRVAIERPRLIREIDKAARLDHQVIGARVLVAARPRAESRA